MKNDCSDTFERELGAAEKEFETRGVMELGKIVDASEAPKPREKSGYIVARAGKGEPAWWSRWYNWSEDIPCPYCGKPIDIEYVLNQKGADFEGMFMGARPENSATSCPHCDNMIMSEPCPLWRIRKLKLDDTTK